MDLTPANLQALNTGFRANFNRGFVGVLPEYREIAMEVPSSTESNSYGWMGDMPEVREWLGERVVHQLNAYGFTLVNKRFELTIGVDVDKIEDDQYGVYGPIMTEFGRSVGRFPNKLVMSILRGGTSGAAIGFDGKPLLATDHPRLNAAGKPVGVSNWAGGAGSRWYLADLSRAIKPLVYQPRKAFGFVRKDRPEDDNVFDNNEIRYGTNGRCNAGPGFWQLIYGSGQELNVANFEAAKTAFEALKLERSDEKAGVMATHLIVPTDLEGAGRRILKAGLVPQTVGDNTVAVTNVWENAAQLLVLKSL
ncbi:MAG: hypothetical protein GC168_20605 [Candidatus Hydrogenedens sp.]|nr:hypothetical protein [Candidatus Hydrogenedens sp.]